MTQLQFIPSKRPRDGLCGHARVAGGFVELQLRADAPGRAAVLTAAGVTEGPVGSRIAVQGAPVQAVAVHEAGRIRCLGLARGVSLTPEQVRARLMTPRRADAEGAARMETDAARALARAAAQGEAAAPAAPAMAQGKGDVPAAPAMAEGTREAQAAEPALADGAARPAERARGRRGPRRTRRPRPWRRGRGMPRRSWRRGKRRGRWNRRPRPWRRGRGMCRRSWRRGKRRGRRNRRPRPWRRRRGMPRRSWRIARPRRRASSRARRIRNRSWRCCAARTRRSSACPGVWSPCRARICCPARRRNRRGAAGGRRTGCGRPQPSRRTRPAPADGRSSGAAGSAAHVPPPRPRAAQQRSRRNCRACPPPRPAGDGPRRARRLPGELSGWSDEVDRLLEDRAPLPRRDPVANPVPEHLSRRGL